MITDGFYVFHKIVVLKFFNALIIIVQFIAVTENNRVAAVAKFPVNMDDFASSIGI